MKHLLAAVLLFSAALFSAEIAWKTDIAVAFADAKAQQKIVMIDFYTDWCGWCKKLDAETYVNANVLALAKDFVALKVNPEKSKQADELRARYNVQGYPNIVFADADGAIVYLINGFAGPKEFAQKMTDVLAMQKKFIQYQAEYRKGITTNGAEYLDLLVMRQRILEAIPLFHKLSGKGFSKEKRAQYELSFGAYYGEHKDYRKALAFFQDAEKNGAGNETAWQAIYYRAVTMNLSGNTKGALSLLKKYIDDKKTPAVWKERLGNLSSELSQEK
ncbi:MAG: thioredoxin family protein [Spirochaetes bacterium]|nr:thioredoxin family protein [Spirochaetota bacterium]